MQNQEIYQNQYSKGQDMYGEPPSSQMQLIQNNFAKSDQYSPRQDQPNTLAGMPPQYSVLPMPDIPERMNFQNYNVIVTGASSGIGKKVAKLLLQRGAYVVLITRYPERCERIINNPQNIRPPHVIKVDLTDPVGTEREFRNIMEILDRRLDILINAHGDLSSKPIKETTLRDWDLSTNMNVRSVLQLISLSSTYLKQSKGSIVNITSTYGSVPKPGSVSFSVSKACLNMLTQCAALELAPFGVRVNAVAAGVTNTKGRLNVDQQIALTAAENMTLMKKIAEQTPLGQITTKQDVAEAILWLGNKASSFVTGEILNVDGGSTLISAGCFERWSQSKVPAKKEKGFLEKLF